MSGTTWRGAARTDANQSDVVNALRAADFHVWITSGASKGFPDLMASCWAQGIGPVTVLLEVKDGNKPPARRALTPDQVRFARFFLGPLAVVYSGAEAVWLMKMIRGGTLAALEAQPFRDRLPTGRRGAFGRAPDLTVPGHLPFPTG